MIRRKKVVLSFFLVIVALLSLVGATLAWMTMSAAPIVSEMDLYLVSGNGEAFQIAGDENGKPGPFGMVLKLSEALEGERLLKPVSFSGSEQAFFLPEMALDGRIAAGKMLPLPGFSALSGQESADASLAADKEALAGYVYTADFWMHSDVSKITVSLSPSPATSSGVPVRGCYAVGEPVWDDGVFLHKNGGNGAELAIRIGFYFHGTENNPDDTRFVIYEPNADGGAAVFRDGTPFTPEVRSPENDLTGNNPRVTLIQQGTSSWSETYPVLKNEVNYLPAPFLSSNLDLIDMEAGENRKVTLYVWLEGQDADCMNSISAGQILANISLAARVYGELPLQPE